MRSSLVEHAPDLLSLVDMTAASLLANEPLPAKRWMRMVWRSAWGRCAYDSGVPDVELTELTRARKLCLECVFGHAVTAVRQAVDEGQANADTIRQRLFALRPDARPQVAAVLLAIDAAFELQWLEQQLKGSRLPLKLALCYSAFGDIATTITAQAQELSRLFHSVPAELHIFSVAGTDDTTAVPQQIDSVRVHFRHADLSELVAFPGIKAPGLLGACADAVQHGVDFVITIDGDGRLPLWETIPAIAAMMRSHTLDAALGSRRIAGALVSKPGLRHMTSMMNACYVEVLMGPVMGVVRDPQAIFKVYRASRLACALKRLGHDNVNGWSLNELQDGSLACELMLLANLTANGRPPQILEVPSVETMAYPANPGRMPILTGRHVSGMVAAANRPRKAVRERPLLGEGTESLVLRRCGDVVKLPRRPERPAVRGLLPTSRVADNRLVQFAMSFKGATRTVVCNAATRSHPDRGFGVSPGAVDLINDDRREVKKYLPEGLGYEYLDHAIRLPFPSSVVLRAFWRIDTWLWASGALLEWIGNLPLTLVRIIGQGARVTRLMGRMLRLIARPAKTILLKAASWLLRIRDLLGTIACRCACRVVTMLELSGALRVFAALDWLDQRSRVFHGCLRGLVRALAECRWLLECFNVSVHFGRPVPCIVQRQPLRPFWSILETVPVSMTGEIRKLLDEAAAVYRSLGKAGYCDGELSLDNLGFIMNDGVEHAVLMDYGAVVNASRYQPTLLRQWLRAVRDDFSNSFQVYKLRRYAHGNRQTQQVVENYIKQCLEFVERWKQDLQ